MLNKRKAGLAAITVILAGMGFWLINTNTDLKKNLSAFLYHVDVVADASDGTALPDYRFIKNQKVPDAEDTKESIVIPESLQIITENHCKHILLKLDAGRPVDKIEVAYTIVCYNKYPQHFVNFFKSVETKTEMENRLRPVATEVSTSPTTVTPPVVLPDNLDAVDGTGLQTNPPPVDESGETML